MKYIVVSVFTAAALLAAISCTSIVTVNEYQSARPHTHVDTVYVIVDPSENPEGQGSGSGPEIQPGSGETGEYADPWITYHSLYGGARVETCTYQSGRTKHTLIGNLVTGSGPHLEADARVWRNGNIIEEIVLILEFEPSSSGSGGTEDTPDDISSSRNDFAATDGRIDPMGSAEARFLHIRSAGQQYSFDLDDCSSVDVDSENDQISVEVTLPVSLALLRDISHSCLVSFILSYPGTDSFTKYFTEINDGNMYQFYTLFVVGDGNPPLMPVEN